MTTTVEREVKLRFDSVEAARAAVLATGATPLLCRRLQEDSLLDTDDEAAPPALRPARPHGERQEPDHVQGPGPAVGDEAARGARDGRRRRQVVLRIFEELGLHVGSATRSIARSSRTRT